MTIGFISDLLLQNVAQNTVVGLYDKIVPGGFGGAQADYNNIIHQYTTLQSKAGDQIIPGGTCDRHLENSETVSVDDAAGVAETNGLLKKPVTSFKGKYSNVLKDHPKFDTKETCFFG